jgi:predicted RNA methylase
MASHVSEKRTEDIALELLHIQSWPTARPPKGCLVRQNEYKAYSTIEHIFKGKSKSGKGDGYPDFLLVAVDTLRPQLLIETKATAKELDEAINEACFYGDACRAAGFSVIAVGVAGQEKSGIRVAVKKFINGTWQSVTYESNPITWIPTLTDTERLIATSDAVDLTPVVPRPEILAGYAEAMNRILREANVKDEYRPAYIGAIMLALWEAKGLISREPDRVLTEINTYCQQSFAIGGKQELARSLRVDEANSKLAHSIWQIIATLEKLNVVAGSVDHDYLGQLYEQFFRYTGGNTIGQYFTPRHITRFMVDICQTAKDDKIIDPACGTGGFLIASIQRAYDELGLKYEDVISIIQKNLIGYESEPVTAALCVANMIWRGDGRTGIRKNDCFSAVDYPVGECQVALMNPPFPHKQTDVSPQAFVERALEALKNRGLLAVILPTSLLVKKDIGEWRATLLRSHTLQAVCQLPDELFQPYASATTSIVVLEKGVPQSSKKQTLFVRLQYDGLMLRKGTRVNRSDGKNEIPQAVEVIINRKEVPGFSGLERR